MSDLEIDEKTLALMTARAAELGYDNLEDYVWALLEKDPADPEAHARMRRILEGGQGDFSGN